jgi:four helix bundle protein
MIEENKTYYFDHEKLNVYQRSIEFVEWSNKLLKKKKIKTSTADQLERAADSIVLNITEGNGKFTPKDKCRYFDISRGSAMESSGCLDVLFAKNFIDDAERNVGKLILVDIIKMLMGLIKANSNRTYENDAKYETEQDHENEQDQEKKSKNKIY